MQFKKFNSTFFNSDENQKDLANGANIDRAETRIARIDSAWSWLSIRAILVSVR